jgi:cytokinesis protein
MRHLLLIRGETDEQARYYQLVDSLISSIVLDRNPNFAGGLSSITGVSVARLVAQMGDQDRTREVEDEVKGLRARLVELDLEREDMRTRLAQSADGLVGDLQARVKSLEEKLRVSRQTTESLKGQINEQKRGYAEQIQQLEVQITELFRMLRDANGFENLGVNVENVDGVTRSDMVMTLSKQMERQKTIGILEGSHRRRKKKGLNVASPSPGKYGDTDDEDENANATDDETETRRSKVSRSRLKAPRPSDEAYDKDAEGEDENADDSTEHLVSGCQNTLDKLRNLHAY